MKQSPRNATLASDVQAYLLASDTSKVGQVSHKRTLLPLFNSIPKLGGDTNRAFLLCWLIHLLFAAVVARESLE